MNQISTITSKRQLTIPAKIFKKAGLKEGQKVIIEEINGKLTIQPTLNLIEKLAGSVTVPKKYKQMDIENIIQQAKQEYFYQKKL